MAEVEMEALPQVSSDAQLILKLQEKLTALNAQVHTWKARCKGKFAVLFLRIELGIQKDVFDNRFEWEQKLQFRFIHESDCIAKQEAE